MAMETLKLNSNDAMALACRAMGHDRFDRGGNPYVLHLAEVVGGLRDACAQVGIDYDDEVAQAAILHDIAEDHGVTMDHLRTAGYSERVVALVDALTHRPGEARLAYLWRILQHEDAAARAIKHSDARSNNDMRRLNRPPKGKDLARATSYMVIGSIMVGRRDELNPRERAVSTLAELLAASGLRQPSPDEAAADGRAAVEIAKALGVDTCDAVRLAPEIASAAISAMAATTGISIEVVFPKAAG